MGTVTKLPATPRAMMPAQPTEDEPDDGPITENDGMRGKIGAGIAVIAVVFGGVGLWSVTATLEGAVVATGDIQVETARKAVQHLEGGIVSEIRVRDGDAVKAGDLLIRLHDTAVGANLRLVQGQVAELMIRRARLVAERDGLDDISLPQVIQARAENREIDDILSGQRALFQARRASRLSEIGLLRQQQEQLQTQTEGLRRQQASKAKEIAFYEDELEGLRKLFAKGLTPKSRLLALERAAETARGEEASHAGGIATAQMRVNEIELQILRLDKSFQEKVAEELRAVEAEINAISERLISTRDQAERTEIRAPQSGRVHNLAVHTVGGVIKAGETIMEIVPGEDNLVIGARIALQDIDKVQVQAPTTVRLSAFNQRTTPELTGAVQRVSADQLTDRTTGESHYLAIIQIPPEEIDRLRGLELRPGMPAEVLIHTGSRTPISYLLKPLADNFSRAFKED